MSLPVPESLRILFVAPYLPSAIRVRPFHLIRHLVEAGHRVTVAALDDRSPADAASLAELQAVCEAVHVVPHSRLRAVSQAAAALPTPTPLWAAWCHSPRMVSLLRSLAESGQFDAAHIEHLRAAHFSLALRDIPCVFDAVDCITDLQRQFAARAPWTSLRHWLAWEEAIKLQRYEAELCSRFRQVVVTSQHDAEAIRSLGVRSPIAVIPNGVERGAVPSWSDKDGSAKRFDIIFSGKMSYQANEDAALFLLHDILPRLDNLLTEASPVTVCIAGAGPSDRLRKAASRWEDRVTITGWAEDLRPFLARARISVCPMRIGVGIQNKVLEAMAMGVPVVATPLASRAFDQDMSVRGLRIAADGQSFAHHCADLLMNEDEARKTGKSGYDYVRKFHRWETAADKFVGQYRRVITGGSSAVAEPG